MGANSTTDSSAQTITSHIAHFIFKPKRIVFAAAGAFAVVGGAAALQAPTPDNSKTNATDQSLTLQPTSTSASGNTSQTDVPDTTSSASSTNLHVSTNGTAPSMQLNVNGQDISIPTNGTTQQTITSTDGASQTSVSASSNVTSHGDASNNSSTSFSMNISSSSGGTSQ